MKYPEATDKLNEVTGEHPPIRPKDWRRPVELLQDLITALADSRLEFTVSVEVSLPSGQRVLVRSSDKGLHWTEDTRGERIGASNVQALAKAIVEKAVPLEEPTLLPR